MVRFGRLIAVFLMSWCAIGGARADGGWLSSAGDAEFLEPDEVFMVEPVHQDGDFLSVQGHIAKGYYVYRQSLKIVSGDGSELAITLPQGITKRDEFFGETEIYTGDALRLRWQDAGAQATLHWQGCAEAGVCYPPQTIALGSRASAGADVTNKRESSERSSAPGANPAVAEDQSAAQRLAALGPFWGPMLFFGFGLLLAFTPCTLPMIPIVSSIVVGSQAKPRRAFALSASYVLAMATTYAVVGVVAGLAGSNVQATLQSPLLLGTFAVLFLVLASSLFGMFELRLPSALVNRVESAGRIGGGGSLSGAAALGFLSALLVGPCMTAPLAGALLYIGQTGSALHGGVALFALGVGMGLPLLAIAVFGARVLPKPGAWMDRVKVGFGYVMVGMAALMLDRFVPAPISLVVWATWGLSVTVGLLAWANAVATRHRLLWTLRTAAVVIGLWSILLLVGGASGGTSSLQPLSHLRGAPEQRPAQTSQPTYAAAKSVADVNRLMAKASEQGRWTLIDFYADWCVSCHVIERKVFGNATVATRLGHMQVIRPDVTRNDTIDQELLKHWEVLGPPTLILVGPDGTERRELRMVGEVDADRLLHHLDLAGTP
ncbi:Thiol:disulfide interchange protein DsbD [Achromobacter mucicolens]|uniref:protein-disulfide reductase DsbD n=1 Tax=Achromobacter mucicolens TaxID=1389922 RepID=UPI001467F601|nr:protein-disulfide reductase DsbD [Achromobacter mucicolens]CAB3832059.1 Thiol:disulfide interchange protein DsbD [Achromobacter mucicolens]